MNPTQGSGVDMNAIREALARRGMGPSMSQGPTTPALGQIGSPTGGAPLGGQVQRPPTPQPKFGSPFAGPRMGVGGRFDDQTRQMSKSLIQKLLQVI